MEYTLEFHTLVAQSGWNESTLKEVFCHGLNHDMLKEITCWDESATLNSLINLAIKMDNLLKDWSTSISPAHTTKVPPAPIQVRHTHLSLAERTVRPNICASTVALKIISSLGVPRDSQVIVKETTLRPLHLTNHQTVSVSPVNPMPPFTLPVEIRQLTQSCSLRCRLRFSWKLHRS